MTPSPFTRIDRDSETSPIAEILSGPHIKRVIAGEPAPYIEIEPLQFFRVRFDRYQGVGAVVSRTPA